MDTPIVRADVIELIYRVAKVIDEWHILVIVDPKANFGVSEFGELDRLLEETNSSLFEGHSADPLVVNLLNLNLFSSHGFCLLFVSDVRCFCIIYLNVYNQTYIISLNSGLRI